MTQKKRKEKKENKKNEDEVDLVDFLQARPGAAVEVFPPRGPADEHELAGVRHRVGERHPAGHRTRREQVVAQAALPEERVSGGTQHYPDHRHRLLLCEYCIRCIHVLAVYGDGLEQGQTDD